MWIVNKSSNIINYYMWNVNTIKILIGRFLVTWPSVMLDTDSKHHIDRKIFSNIVLSSWVLLLWCHILLLWCHIILLWRHIVLLFDRNVTLVLPSPSWEWPSFHVSDCLVLLTSAIMVSDVTIGQYDITIVTPCPRL